MAARSDAPAAGGKRSALPWLVGVAVLAAAAGGGFVALKMGIVHLPGSHEDDSVLAKAGEAPTTETPAPKHVARGKSSTMPADGENLDAPAAEPADALPDGRGGRAGGATTTGRSAMRLASTSSSSAAVVTAVTPDAPRHGSQLAHLDEHVTYQYNALGRRDPFQSLISGEFVGADVGGDAPPDPGGMKIVGIVWGPTDQFAMVEDVRGNSYVLRKGDKLQNGYVESLRRDAVVINVTADGQSQQVVIPFVRKGDANVR